MLWNSTGSALLAETASDTDATNQSVRCLQMRKGYHMPSLQSEVHTAVPGSARAGSR